MGLTIRVGVPVRRQGLLARSRTCTYSIHQLLLRLNARDPPNLSMLQTCSSTLSSHWPGLLRNVHLQFNRCQGSTSLFSTFLCPAREPQGTKFALTFLFAGSFLQCVRVLLPVLFVA